MVLLRLMYCCAAMAVVYRAVLCQQQATDPCHSFALLVDWLTADARPGVLDVLVEQQPLLLSEDVDELIGDLER